MSNIKYIGQKPIFSRKFLADICKNLKNFGVGRIVYNEKDISRYSEPCYFIIKEAEPHMATEENTRCRVKAERIFRGKNMGVVNVRLSHFPTWSLVNKSDEHLFLKADHTQPGVKVVENVYDYPPALSEYIKKKFLNNQYHPKMLVKPFDHLMEFKKVEEPSEEIKKSIFPPYRYLTKRGLTNKRSLDIPNSYFIKIAKYPGLKWRVFLKPKDSLTTSEKLDLSQ